MYIFVNIRTYTYVCMWTYMYKRNCTVGNVYFEVWSD